MSFCFAFELPNVIGRANDSCWVFRLKTKNTFINWKPNDKFILIGDAIA